MNIKLGVDMTNMAFNRIVRYMQVFRYEGTISSSNEQSKYIDLPRGEKEPR